LHYEHCDVADDLVNVSASLLSQDLLCGYYIHGRSLMTFADTSMLVLNAELRKEQVGSILSFLFLEQDTERSHKLQTRTSASLQNASIVKLVNGLFVRLLRCGHNPLNGRRMQATDAQEYCGLPT
jgi:hypothetical protein